MRIAVDQEILAADAAFSCFGELDFFAGRQLTSAQLRDADALIVRSVTRVDAALLDGTAIKFVGTATAGCDHLDVQYLEQRAIEYFNAAGCNARAVAEYVVAVCLLHHALWLSGAPVQVGIIGYGHVGTHVAEMLTALGLHCVLNDPPLACEKNDPQFVSLEEALASDVVTIHVPYTDDGPFPTKSLLGATEIEQLGPQTLVINAARGGVVDETQLYRWLERNPCAAAAIDCWQGEPLLDRHLMQRATIATPHIAGHARDARLRATALVAARIAALVGESHDWRAHDDDQIAIDLHEVDTGDHLAVLRAAVLQCCDPRIPDAAMRALSEQPDVARAQSFDQQRRDAAARREFPAHRVARTSLPPDTVQCLRKLGFRISTDNNCHGG